MSLGLLTQTELGEQRVDALLDGPLRQVEALGDRRVGRTARHLLEHSALRDR
jgi:hypothetical protein